VVRKFNSLINILSDCDTVTEKVKVGMRGQVVIPKKLRQKYGIEEGIILEIDDTKEGLLLKPFNPLIEMKGLGKGVFGDPVKYQKKLREEWVCDESSP
jgi:AbrB family looped-hinge helix DNA binding protein